MPVQMIGDVLTAELSHMQPYVRFCSNQINGAVLLQTRIDNEPDFKNFLKVGERERESYSAGISRSSRLNCQHCCVQKIATDYRCKGMPLSSFLLKPMQRITRYPLHIKSVGCPFCRQTLPTSHRSSPLTPCVCICVVRSWSAQKRVMLTEGL